MLGEKAPMPLYASTKEISPVFPGFPKEGRWKGAKWHIICFLIAKIIKEGPEWVHLKT
jgi:hypothetical protein